MTTREKSIHRATVGGGIVDVALLLLKLVAGIVGHSAAMIAAAVDSLADIITDVVLLVFVKLSNKPKDADHDYGHGKYETLASAIVAILMIVAGIMILYDNILKIVGAINGEQLPAPGTIALIIAVVSVAAKGWAFRFTMNAGRKHNSQAMIAMAWNHGSDVLYLLGMGLGIGCAILLGGEWTVLDPIAAVILAGIILHMAYKILRKAVGELLEQSLTDDVENEIIRIAMSEEGVSDTHNLRTRHIGNHIAIEMHIRLPGDITLYEAHKHATNIEQKLREEFGNDTHIGLHVEPKKVGGKYVEPNKESEL